LGWSEADYGWIAFGFTAAYAMVTSAGPRQSPIPNLNPQSRSPQSNPQSPIRDL
jgi:hypothetical protein